MSSSTRRRKASAQQRDMPPPKRLKNLALEYLLLDSNYQPIAIDSFSPVEFVTIERLRDHLSKRHRSSIHSLRCVEEDHQFDSKPLQYYEDLNQDWRAFLKSNGRTFNQSKFDEDRGEKVWIFVTTETEQTTEPSATAYDAPYVPYITQEHFLKQVRSKNYMSPSLAAKDQELGKKQRIDNKAAFYNGRPAALTGPPLGVYHPVFARFMRLIEEVEKVVLTPEHLRLASELIDVSTNFYNHEQERHEAIRKYLETFIDDVVRTSTSLGSNQRDIKPDGGPFIDTFAGRTTRNPIFEFKREIGTGGCDPLDQAAEVFVQTVCAVEADPIRQRSCMPVFLVAVAGPTIAIGGALLLDRPVIELLTPWIPLRYRPTVGAQPTSAVATDRQIRYLALVLYALGTCLQGLRNYYKVTLASTPERPPFGVPWPHLTTIGDYKIEYQKRLWPTPSRCLFLAKATKENTPAVIVVVKFTNRYCREAHEVVFKKGAAPQLLHCAWDETVGQTVVMCEYVDATKVDPKKPPLSCDESICALETAVLAMHEAGFVHGDLRRSNILLDSSRTPMIVDFDWAGPIDGPDTLYPINICLDASYELHNNVHAGRPILAEHDDHLVRVWVRQARNTGLVDY